MAMFRTFFSPDTDVVIDLGETVRVMPGVTVRLVGEQVVDSRRKPDSRPSGTITGVDVVVVGNARGGTYLTRTA